MDEDASGGALFEDVVFTLIPSDDYDDEHVHGIREGLETSGGRFVPLRASDQEIDGIENITHIISTHIDFPQYDRAVELGIHVVKPSWVYTSLRKRKQAHPRQHSPDPSQYFGEIILTCAELPEGDAEAIIAGVVALGGQHTYPLTKLVTHIVTTDLDNEKCRIAQDKGLKVKIVLPHWFDDCLRLGKKISEKPYEFPNPEILRKGNNAHVRPTSSAQLEGATTASPPELPDSTPPPSPTASRKFLNIFMSKKIFFAKDLELSDRLHETLIKLINHGGGVLTKDVSQADYYIGCYRDGEDYVAASRAGIDVASLAWLYHVINRNRYSSPRSKLFHYPVPRHGLKGFENLKISLSNYGGDARTYVENLIRACGAEYTKTMKQDNTHLVSAHKTGEKCEAAQEWNIELVNHLWLEESYAKSTMQSMTNPKFHYFPTRTNLGEVAGQTALDMKKMEQLFFPKPRSPVKPKQSPRKPVPASSALTGDAAPTDYEEPGIPVTVAEPDEMDVDQDQGPKTVKKSRGRPSRSSMATPRAGIDDEKENESPAPTSTGRAAKNKALNTLHTQSVDIALYQKESKRKGGVIHGGRRGSRPDDASSPVPARSSRKRPSEEYDVTAEGSDLSDGETQEPAAAKETKQKKKAKHGPSPTLPPIEYRMMITGDSRWAENDKKESADKNTLRSLGVLLTQDPKDVDILVAPKILRTKKFVCALACAPLVVDTSFLDIALSKKKLIDDPPMLKDKDAEERLGFTLADALERAQKSKRKLFKNWAICVTKEVNGGFDTYKDIIGLNGGEAFMYTGRPNMRFSASPEGANDDFDYVYLVSGTSPAEVELWKKFHDDIESRGLQARVVSSDWVLNAAMGQQVQFQEKWLLS
ncbi:hypothetical protein M409DRAFT_58359 [Zasmidium cellare ATCC 36951]|uniref:BRCT domain-containing protein n=1 Tax=Zasmidium cellare ATCC 36951 TaxID=1080233 RepID=A0A6A6C8M3_ZASCE|nr:uncharacterized protein M409DRAFT_58359 [Zasmidium cellare ATCC 36951]KAF2162242.1 hypothetical protein M409DRAFT_58359 [Zasmidium cellare ATCC 36951]